MHKCSGKLGLESPGPCVLVAQSYPTLCHHMDRSLPGFFVHGILQARILECVAISFSRQTLISYQKTNISVAPLVQDLGHSVPCIEKIYGVSF